MSSALHWCKPYRSRHRPLTTFEPLPDEVIPHREKTKCLPQVGVNILEKKNQILLPNVRIFLVCKGPWWSTADAGIDMVCTNISRGSFRFPLGKPMGRIVRKRSHKTGTHLYRRSKMSWGVLGGLGRSLPVFAGITLLTTAGPEPK